MNRNREDMTLALADALEAWGRAGDPCLAATRLRRLVLESIEADTVAMELSIADLRANKLDDAP